MPGMDLLAGAEELLVQLLAARKMPNARVRVMIFFMFVVCACLVCLVWSDMFVSGFCSKPVECGVTSVHVLMKVELL